MLSVRAMECSCYNEETPLSQGVNRAGNIPDVSLQMFRLFRLLDD